MKTMQKHTYEMLDRKRIKIKVYDSGEILNIPNLYF